MSINMDRVHILEEKLRESACVGDLESVMILLQKGVDVNAKHCINGWTPLHWAVKRGHKAIVRVLLSNGADVNLRTKDKESVLSLCSSSDIRSLLKSQINEEIGQDVPSDSRLPITPHYLKHPPLADSVDLKERRPASEGHATSRSLGSFSASPELVLKVRIANFEDPDFIEVEIPTGDLSYSCLLQVCAEELAVNPIHVTRVRKLPNTIVRKDKDVARLKDGQEIELVLKTDGNSPFVRCSNGLLKRINGNDSNSFTPASCKGVFLSFKSQSKLQLLLNKLHTLSSLRKYDVLY